MSNRCVLDSRSSSGRVLVLTLNRPTALNALSAELFTQLNELLEAADKDKSVHAIVITGGDKVFAAGADIKQMENRTCELSKLLQLIVPAMSPTSDPLAHWSKILAVKKPIIAAVTGYALGGGLELALMCDMLVCAPDAVFGLPELKLGIIPAAGGTQRLTGLIGKARAMDVVLNGRRFTGTEAGKWGVATTVIQKGENVTAAAVAIGERLSDQSATALVAGKQAVNACE